MKANTLGSTLTLAGFLRDRRARLRPAPGSSLRRRTPGLRREEVATRAHVSLTWYTWLEQGRGGPPSAEVLERLSGALELDAAEREVLFLLAQQRPPPLRPTAPSAVPASLQRVLDAFPTSPAIVKTPSWDLLAWNDAALAVLADFTAMSPNRRNVLRRLFDESAIRKSLPDWEADARFALAAFRVDAARAGDCPQAAALAAELLASSVDFRRLWAENEVRSFGAGVKRLHHPVAGLLTLEYSTFAVDGGAGQTMLVFTPTTSQDEMAIASLVSLYRARAG